MKKLIITMLVLLCFFFLFSACKNDDPPTNTTQGGITASSPLNTDLEAADMKLKQNCKLTVEKFLTSIKDKELEQIVELWSMDDIGADKFFNSINIESFNIVEESRLDDSHMEYRIEMNVTTSVSALFPVGQSVWEATVYRISDYEVYSPADYSVVLFKPVGKTIDGLNIEEQSDDFIFCRRFATFFRYFETANDLNKMVPDAKNADSYNSFCYDLISFLNDQLVFEADLEGNSVVPEEQVLTLSKKVLGITKIDLSRYSQYNKTNRMITHDGMGLPRYFCSLSSKVYEPTTKQSDITIDYYSDRNYFIVGKTVEYVVRENADKSYTLLSTKLVFDSGFGLAHNSDTP